ncbi:MAG: SDR family NAD(P)-dependent oxidoreductase [Deltaproteobacteria bacterium]|nr:SDR family NAD(P)-dependent oxidoreductase [Deltaproteobacteria bacterium]MBW2446859.1 SDR family NAD(P)-dependent oxidoreductase [Deltaproteobacteria bacterium]
MKDFTGKIAVVTGGGTGMGRELVKQLAAEGCHVAMCDVSVEHMEETATEARNVAPDGTRITSHECDVSDEAQVLAFRDAVAAAHETDCVHLVFNNAGIGAGGSLLHDDRDDWERTFNVCWYGVYFCTRAFLPLLVASEAGHLVNTSSVNGFWASIGPMTPHTAYSAAKFAVKGFTEALITDLRLNAPHVKVSVVMPGHVGTSIIMNSASLLGRPAPKEMTSEDLEPARDNMERMGMPRDGLTDDQLRQMLDYMGKAFRDLAPLSAADASTQILDGVREERWRILVGEDAKLLDRFVRETPEDAYELAFMEKLRENGAFAGIGMLTPPGAE